MERAPPLAGVVNHLRNLSFQSSNEANYCVQRSSDGAISVQGSTRDVLTGPHGLLISMVSPYVKSFLT